MAATLTPERAREDQSDTDLVAAVRTGDDDAFAALYARYHEAIVRFAHGMVRDWARAEDVSQEVFISALRRIRETERPINFRPWVYEIARNACIDHFRRSKRAEELSIDGGALRPRERAELADRRAVPERAVEVGEQMDHLRGAFGGLSDNHHRILVLRELEGLSYREIGERMGMTRPSVESTLFRARRRLGEEYADVQTGRRCNDVREALGPVAGGIAGVRERRRVQRHLAWCSSCRSAARHAGLESGLLVPQGVGARAAALLPLPTLPSIVFDPAADWFRATAAALGLAAASTGASLAVYAVPDKPLPRPLLPAPQASAPARAVQSESLDHARRAARTRATRAIAAHHARAQARAQARRHEASSSDGLSSEGGKAGRRAVEGSAAPAAKSAPRAPIAGAPAAPSTVATPGGGTSPGPVSSAVTGVARTLDGIATSGAARVGVVPPVPTSVIISSTAGTAAHVVDAALGGN